ncbi:MAG: sugar O-acetyltransferase [Photobacterium frigidiphilum]|uniref:sugar O-acetyltransferase n=1 Tax=Photobacterium frigidiphilum TaxID=264736 RepID=UPI0030025A90
MNELEKMRSGLLYDGNDASIDTLRQQSELLIIQLRSSPSSQHQALLKLLLGSLGDNSVIRMPFSCEFGKTIHIGSSTFLNAGIVMLDNADIYIGDNVLIGPSTQFFTPTHSLDHESRRRWESWCKPITVENDVWIGGNVSICQGVTIGARSVVAAGSVVTHDVPPDTLVGGTPAKVIRPINSSDTAR